MINIPNGSKIHNGSKFFMVQKQDKTCRVVRTNLYVTINSFHLYLWTVCPCIGGNVRRWGDRMLRLGQDAVHSLRPARSKVVVKLGVHRAPS